MLLIWVAVLYFAHLQIGLIAVAVGFMVATAVRRGSGRAGELLLQIIAVTITYLAIGLTYDLDWLLSSPRHSFGPEVMFTLAIGLFCFPIAVNMKSVIGLVIIGIALYEAWKPAPPAG